MDYFCAQSGMVFWCAKERSFSGKRASLFIMIIVFWRKHLIATYCLFVNKRKRKSLTCLCINKSDSLRKKKEERNVSEMWEKIIIIIIPLTYRNLKETFFLSIQNCCVNDKDKTELSCLHATNKLTTTCSSALTMKFDSPSRILHDDDDHHHHNLGRKWKKNGH